MAAAAATSSLLLLPFLYALLSLLLARLLRQAAGANWGRAVAAPFRSPTAPETEEEEEEEGSGENLVECVVCLFPLREGNEAWQLECGHLFHTACLHRWVEHHRSTCPLCQSYLPLAVVETTTIVIAQLPLC